MYKLWYEAVGFLLIIFCFILLLLFLSYPISVQLLQCCSLKRLFFPLELLFHFCHKAISHICGCLFLDYLFCFIYFCISIPLPILHSFDYCNYMSWYQVGWFPSLYYFFQNCLEILVPMSFYLNFKIILSYLQKNCLRFW